MHLCINANSPSLTFDLSHNERVVSKIKIKTCDVTQERSHMNNLNTELSTGHLREYEKTKIKGKGELKENFDEV